MADVLAICVRFAVAGVLGWIWDNVVGLPKARKKTTFVEALMKARRAEIVRLARLSTPTIVPGLSHLFEDERLILSMPVFLYESVSGRRLYPPASKLGRKLVWEHRASSGKLIVISPVDRGALRLTNRRFVFAGARRQREFPVDELTHFSTTWSSIALAARGRLGISYFTGLNASRLRFPVIPEAGDLWQAQAGSFNVRGVDLKDILDLMRDPSPPALS